MEQEFTVEAYGVKCVCDECKKGEMIPTGTQHFYENHIGYIHKCTNCGIEKEYSEKYPLIRYRSV